MQYKIKPWQHQLDAIDLARPHSNFGFFFPPGCGKTGTLVNVAREVFLKEQGDERRPISTLILCPQIVIENWKREWLMHSHVRPSQIHCLRGSSHERATYFQFMTELDTHQIFITNYESLNMKYLFAALKKWKPQMVVLDESHKCKDYTAKRTKRVLELGKTSRYRYILSGTPVLGSLFDIYTQYLFLDHGETFSPDFRKFRSEYFYDRNEHRPRHTYYPDWVAKPGADRAINEKIYRKAIRVEKNKAIDLPPFVRQTIEIELEGKLRKTYDAMEKDAVAVIDDQTASADLAIKKALRLQQLTTGFIKDDEGKIITFPDNPRINALSEIIDSLGDEKFIVWAVFKQNYEDIKYVLRKKNIPFGEVHGAISSTAKQNTIDVFNSPSKTLQAIVAHPASGGIGINLVAAPYAIFYSRDFSLENDIQAEARNYRGGSERHAKITRIDIVARGTIDEAILEALATKQNISEAVLKYAKGINHERINDETKFAKCA